MNNQQNQWHAGPQGNGQQQGNQFTPVGGSGQGVSWDPRATEKNGMSFTPGSPSNVLMGYLVAIVDGIPTQFEKPMSVYHIQVVNHDGTLGTKYSLVEDTFLRDKVRSIPLNTFIKVEYKGKTLKKGLPTQPWSKTNSYHTWEIGADYGAIPIQNLKQGTASVPQPQIQPVTPQYQQPQAPAAYNVGNQTAAAVFHHPAHPQVQHGGHGHQAQPGNGLQQNGNFLQHGQNFTGNAAPAAPQQQVYNPPAQQQTQNNVFTIANAQQQGGPANGWGGAVEKLTMPASSPQPSGLPFNPANAAQTTPPAPQFTGVPPQQQSQNQQQGQPFVPYPVEFLGGNGDDDNLPF